MKVIGLGRPVSMKVLHEIYGTAVGDDRYIKRLLQ